ncbi:MAG: CDGSH iron-sulfur domain-containing protein [Planctomycetota bacterium]|nr:CDGSH iron-sulfur domain-containing protein [Planctomycetota bacterium]
MNQEPRSVDNKPVVIELDAGKYAWCACGQSSNHPFCDGSHSGSGMTPVVFEVEEKKKVALCACKKTSGAPFCDGSHS